MVFMSSGVVWFRSYVYSEVLRRCCSKTLVCFGLLRCSTCVFCVILGCCVLLGSSLVLVFL